MSAEPDPALARHETENLLHRYAELADECDAEGLGRLLNRAELAFPDAAPVSGFAAVTEHFRHVYRNGARSRHLVSNLIIDRIDSAGGASVDARARYTRWLLDDPPRMVALGQYGVCTRLGASGWYIARLQVDRVWQAGR